MSPRTPPQPYVLARLPPQDRHAHAHVHAHVFRQPSKRINEGEDVSFFLTSRAYADLVTFVFQLNGAMFPRAAAHAADPGVSEDVNASVSRDANPPVSKDVLAVGVMLEKLTSLIDDAPPEQGPRRFGNVAFRKWFQLAEASTKTLLSEHLPHLPKDAFEELEPYLLGSFGSAQRLDYGTGHELSFVAFLAGIWKLDGFVGDDGDGHDQSRNIVLGAIEPYLRLVRRLILTYNLEPAGSHGVWGLDDHSFVPYIFGSAQYSPAISDLANIPTQGSLRGAPKTGDVVKQTVVERERKSNLYFGAIGFIYDVKKGPFWEHSRMLYDISGVPEGWAKINKGMLKMYLAEVLAKYPVVQHFPFGSLFAWEQDPTAKAPPTSTHVANQPAFHTGQTERRSVPAVNAGTTAPWASSAAVPSERRTASATNGPGLQSTRAPWAKSNTVTTPAAMAPTQAPWLSRSAAAAPDGAGATSMPAPWQKDKDKS